MVNKLIKKPVSITAERPGIRAFQPFNAMSGSSYNWNMAMGGLHYCSPTTGNTWTNYPYNASTSTLGGYSVHSIYANFTDSGTVRTCMIIKSPYSIITKYGILNTGEKVMIDGRDYIVCKIDADRKVAHLQDIMESKNQLIV